jgi:hypothetical protein
VGPEGRAQRGLTRGSDKKADKVLILIPFFLGVEISGLKWQTARIGNNFAGIATTHMLPHSSNILYWLLRH